MNKGRLLAHSAPEELIHSVEGKVWEVVVASSDLTELRLTHVVGNTVRSGEGVKVRVIGDQVPTPEAKPATPTLEDAYLHILARESSTPAHV